MSATINDKSHTIPDYLSETVIGFRITQEDKKKLKTMLSSCGMSNAMWLHLMIESDFDIYQKNKLFASYIGKMLESYERLLYVARVRRLLEPSKLKACYSDLQQMQLLLTQLSK